MRFILLCLLPLFAQAQLDLDGSWNTTISGLDMYITIAEESNSVKLTVPAQGLINTKASSVEIEGTMIDFQFNLFNALFKGEKTGSNIIEGTWTQGGVETPLTFSKMDKPLTFNRPQEPSGELPYISTDMTFYNKKSDAKLAGTVTRPKGKGKFPLIILISGSGPQDRNEYLFGHKPFLVLSDYLTKAGYAVVRFDDRGYGQSTGRFKDALTEDFASDVNAIIRSMSQQLFIDNDKIGLLGHSEGGLVAAMVAAENDAVDFVISLAGPGLKGKDILKYQMARGYNALIQDEKKVTHFTNQLIDLVAGDQKGDEIFIDFQKITETFYNSLSYANQQKLAPNAKVFHFKTFSVYMDKWMRNFIKTDPTQYWNKVKVPVLALNGSKDVQVTAKENLKAIKKAVQSGGNKNITAKKMCKMNHLFQKAKTGEGDEYMKIETTIEPKVMEKIVKWTNKL